jgi:hypothetical protein
VDQVDDAMAGNAAGLAALQVRVNGNDMTLTSVVVLVEKLRTVGRLA